jgi:dihydroflavonol-4-reductase
MKAIVTGASGFVGSHLVERLLREGLDVACLVRPSSDRRWVAGLAVEFRSIDAADALAGADYVFHVAGLTRGRSEAEYMAANAEPTRRIVEAALRVGSGLRRFVYVSSLAAAGSSPTERPLDETDEPHPQDSYGRSKRAGEEIVLAAAGRMPVSIVRPPGVYGPRDTNFLPLFRVARRWGLVPVIGGGAKTFTVVHVQDLAEGAWLAASTPAAVGRTYFLGSGTYTMTEWVAAMAPALGRRLRLLGVPRPLALLAGELGQLKWAVTGKPQIVSRRKVRDLLQPRWTCSWDRAAKELGYAPAFDLDRGLRQTVEWYVNEGWLRR